MAVFYPSFQDLKCARVRAASNLTFLERVLNFNSAAKKSKNCFIFQETNSPE